MTNFRTEIAKMRLSVLSLNTAMIRSLVVLTLLVSSFAFAQERSVAPGVNRAYENPDYARWQSAFESEGCEMFEQRHAIVDALAIDAEGIPLSKAIIKRIAESFGLEVPRTTRTEDTIERIRAALKRCDQV